MGNEASVLASELKHPADCSDIDCFADPAAARDEIKRIRRVLAEVGGSDAGRLRAYGLGRESERAKVWSMAAYRRRRKVMPSPEETNDTLTEGHGGNAKYLSVVAENTALNPSIL